LVVSTIWKLVLIASVYQKAPTADGVIYIRAAQELMAGNIRDSLALYPMPAFTLLLGIIHLLIYDWSLAGKILSCIFTLLAQIPLYKITYRWFGPKAAFWATLAFCLQPFANQMSTLILRGPPFIFFLGMAVLAMQRAIDSPSGGRVATAFFFSLLPALFRIEGIFLIPFFPAIYIYYSIKDQRFRGQPLMLSTIWMALMLCLLLYTFFAAPNDQLNFYRFAAVRERAEQLLTFKFMDTYREIYNQIKSLEPLSPYPTQNQNFSEIARHFLWLIYLIGALQTVVKTLFLPYVIPLFVGLRSSAKSKTKFQHFLFFLLILYFLILYLSLIATDFVNRRFVWGIAYLLYPWVGKGMDVLLESIRRKRLSTLLWQAPLALLFFFTPLTGYPKIFRCPDQVSLLSGKWISQADCPRLRIIGNDYRIPLAAGFRFYLDNRPDNPYLDFRPSKTRDFSAQDYSRLEKIALNQGYNLIALKIRHKKSATIPRFVHFQLVKTFRGKKKTVYLFASREIIKKCFREQEDPRQ